jgi:hypothetical protein
MPNILGHEHNTVEEIARMDSPRVSDFIETTETSRAVGQ